MERDGNATGIDLPYHPNWNTTMTISDAIGAGIGRGEERHYRTLPASSHSGSDIFQANQSPFTICRAKYDMI